MKRVLIIEDDESIVVGLTNLIQGEGYQAQVARTGPDGLRAALEEHPDLIILDIMLPGMSGLEICKRVRDQRVRSKIIMLTARSEENDRVFGLELGADDYIVKPFSVRELLARIRVQLRRDPEVAETPRYERFRFGDVLVDFKRRQVFRHGILQPVTPREFRVLEYLLQHPGEVLSRDRLLGEVWGDDARFTTRTVDNHIMRIRKHVEPDPENPRYIKTVRGSGYLLDVAVPAAR
jgi:two-component system, OmpR family, alkaline phosphatase synthesis response regulator PhoP